MGYEPQQDIYPPRQDQYNTQGQYTNAPMYTDNQYQQPLQQDPIHPLPPVQPDPLPRALTQVQVQVNAVTPHPGATMAYIPRLTAPDLFHNTMCGCFKDFFTCSNMGICEFKPPIQKCTAIPLLITSLLYRLLWVLVPLRSPLPYPLPVACTQS